MESFSSAVARGDLRQQGEMHGRLLVRGRDAHQALDLQIAVLAAEGDEGVGLARRDPGLLRAPRRCSPARRGAGVPTLSWPSRSTSARASLVAVQGLDDVEQGHGLGRLVGLQRTDQAQLEAGDPGPSSAQRSCASCTRFSPNTRWPAAMAASTASRGCCFVTAVRVTSDGSRPAAAAALSMRRRTAAQVGGDVGGFEGHGGG